MAFNKLYTVVKDTREQAGYVFNEFDRCEGMVEKKLNTGDYSLIGFEDVLCVERKASIEELAMNVVDPRFDREIERMSKFKYKFLLFEFSLQDVIKWPENAAMGKDQKEKIQTTGKFILKKINEYQLKNGIMVLFCGSKFNAYTMLNSIFKRINEMHPIGKDQNDF